MTNLDHDARRATIRLVMEAIYDSVAVAGERGAPAGVVYAALMTHGCDLQTYQNFENSLTELGVLTKRGQLLFTNPEIAEQYGFGK